jgi:hypothetical protein
MACYILGVGYESAPLVRQIQMGLLCQRQMTMTIER